MNIEEALAEAREVRDWVNLSLNGLSADRLLSRKRSALAGACWHVTIEHEHGIVILVGNKLFGSALALLRPLYESFTRGLWLLHAASDAQVDQAEQDQLPGNKEVVDDLKKIGLAPHLREKWWDALNSYCHTGYRQIGPRLTENGLGQDYDETEIVMALRWANFMALFAVQKFARYAQNEELTQAAMTRLQAVMPK